MSITIDDKTLTDGINKVVGNIFKDYETQHALGNNNISPAIDKMLIDSLAKVEESLDVTELAKQLAVDVVENITAATVVMLRQQTIELLFRMQGGNDFDSNRYSVKESIKADLAHAIQEQKKKSDDITP